MVSKRHGWAILKAWEHGAYCAICGQPLRLDTYGQNHPEAATLDHIEPYMHGGPNGYHNLQLAHKACNVQRGCPPLRPDQLASLPAVKRAIIEYRREKRRRLARKPVRPATTQPWRCAKCDRGCATRQQAYDCCQYGWRPTG